MKKKTAIVIAILIMVVGFAAISTTLIINGTTTINENADDFDIYFSKARLDAVDVYDKVISEDKKTITFETNDLKTLNQTSILTYEVTNNSNNYDAEVTVNCKVKDNTEAKYTSIKNELENNATVIKAKETLNGTLTVTLNKTATEEVKEEYVCTLEFNAVERDALGNNIPVPVSFSTDSWETIQKAVKTGNTSKYNVGDTKTITIASHTNDCSSYSGTGATYKCNSEVEPEKEAVLRISNKSECTNGETSETACGFVIEFIAFNETHNYNKANSESEYGSNVGGWRDSELRTYINEIIYNALPSDLQNVISITKVISGHGSTSGEENFETQDKLYLLNAQEVWGNNNYDTSVGTSKQLDWYKNQGISLNNYSKAIKQYNGSNYSWWLRSAYSSYTSTFLRVLDNGNYGDGNARATTNCIFPAFRIG